VSVGNPAKRQLESRRCKRCAALARRKTFPGLPGLMGSKDQRRVTAVKPLDIREILGTKKSMRDYSQVIRP
jgi:hypothetical protein